MKKSNIVQRQLKIAYNVLKYYVEPMGRTKLYQHAIDMAMHKLGDCFWTVSEIQKLKHGSDKSSKTGADILALRIREVDMKSEYPKFFLYGQYPEQFGLIEDRKEYDKKFSKIDEWTIGQGQKKIFVVKGIPVAKGRPRVARFKSGSARMYTPRTTATYENLIKIKAQDVFKHPLRGPISLCIHFLMPRPKRLIWKTKPMFAVPMETRPDIDNLAKSIMDALNGVAFHDDSQIAVLHVTKMYHAGDGEPLTEIEVEEL